MNEASITPELSERYCFFFCQANDAFVDGYPFKALCFLDDAEKHADSDYCINELIEARKTINEAQND